MTIQYQSVHPDLKTCTIAQDPLSFFVLFSQRAAKEGLITYWSLIDDAVIFQLFVALFSL